jgi:DNA-directed RNA polymerase subunit RPC12/RpoP
MTSAKRRLSVVLTTAFVAVLVLSLVLILTAGMSAVTLVVLLGAIPAMVALIIWHARTTQYDCPDCGATFQITALNDFLSAHVPEKKLLKCPRCGHTNWCTVKP